MTTFSPKFIGDTIFPILIVGEKPNTTRDGSTFALEGNRTGDFVHEAIGDRENIILTNVVNVLYAGEFRHDMYVGDGVIDLMELINTYYPRKIICLGEIAKKYIDSIKHGITTFYMPHPSWINRFRHSTRHEYIKILSDELDK